ncbi:MAG: non-ribosomal peptide synthetase, partial [bacterium]|nr:non-ribosomal peptide synthetase [bacterium]
RQSIDGDSFLCAYYVAPDPQQPEPGLKDYLSQFLPGYMIPTFFIKLEKIPLTPNGKIDRKALSKLQISNADPRAYIAPRNETEEKLSGIWAELLGIQKQAISIDDNFFDIGGHSLRATIMASKIHKTFNVKLPLAEIFKNQSIRKIAGTIKEFKQEKYSSLEPVEKKEYYPLSSAQKRMYFLQQMDLKSTAYNMPFITPIAPAPDKPEAVIQKRLQDAFRKLIRRHESLRTSFEQLGEVPIQRVYNTVEYNIDYYELTGSGRGDAGDEAPAQEMEGGIRTVEQIVKDFLKPFDLSRAPLLRTGIIKQADGHYMLLVDTHHIISDGTSHMILADDFFSLYNTEELKNNVPLKELRLQYKDFTSWQNRLIQKGELKTQEDYWLNLYRGEIPRLNLCTDFKRPEVFSFSGAYHQIQLETEATIGIRALAAESGGTLYMKILALLNTMFYKYTGQTHIVIGSGIAGRPHADLQHIVGMFVNTLAMRNFPNPTKDFDTFLQEVKENTITAYENQEYPFETLVSRLKIKPKPGRNPLFDTLVSYKSFN